MRIIYPMWAGPPSRAAANESSRTLTTQNARWSRVTGRQVSSRYRLPTPRAHFQTEAHDCSKPLGSGLTLFRQVVEALDQAMVDSACDALAALSGDLHLGRGTAHRARPCLR